MTPTEEVLAFFSEWATLDSMIESMERRFTPQTVWENVGLSRTTGLDEALAFTRAFFDQAGVVAGRVDTTFIAATGNTVLTERVDIFFNAAGEQVLAIPIAGVLEMDGPRVIAWRDYFDTRAFAA